MIQLDYYVSPLMFRNIIVENDPVSMCAVIVHDERLQTNHETMFSVVDAYTKHGKQIPVATDEENALINSINNSRRFVRVVLVSQTSLMLP